MRNKFRNVMIAAVLSILPVIAFAGSSTSFHYDELDRLQWLQYDDGTVVSYGYDEIGNRTSQRIYTATPVDIPISVSSMGSGSVSPSGTVYYPSGSTQPTTFYIEPNDSSLIHFYVDGTDVFSSLPYIQGPNHPIYYYTIPNEAIPTITAEHSLQAVFTSNPAASCPDVQMTGVLYPTVQLAINNATNNSTILSYIREYNESINLAQNIQTTLLGGYPCDYNGIGDPVYGYSTITGSLIITQGTLSINNIVLK